MTSFLDEAVWGRRVREVGRGLFTFVNKATTVLKWTRKILRLRSQKETKTEESATL